MHSREVRLVVVMYCIKCSQTNSQWFKMSGKSVERHLEGASWHFLFLSISNFVFMFFHAPVKYKMSL